jgi:signal transduction histidine kinase
MPWIIGGTLLLLAGAGWIFALQRKVQFQKREVQLRATLQRELEQRVAARTEELARAHTELERALSAEQELGKLKSRFVSIVSHEFRTPLAVIGSSAEIMERYHERLSPGQRAEHIEGILKNVRRMARMMEDALLLSRLDGSALVCRPQPLDTGAFCRRLADEMSSAVERRNPISLELGAGLEQAACLDETLLRHILVNLLSNASKYSREGEPVILRARREDDLVRFEIADRGIGIPQADQGRIFETFHRAENVGQIKGTGLGLVIVKRCCELHGGTIAFESEEGAGTTFIVTLPVKPSATQS